MKRIVTIMIISSLISLAFPLATHATQVKNTNHTYQKLNNNYFKNGTRDGSYPNATWDIGKKGKCIMGASVGAGKYMYSSYIMKGKKNYKYSIQNKGFHDIEVQIKNRYSHAIYKVFKIKKETTATGSFSAGNKNSPFYVQFYAPKAFVFRGHIE